MAFAYADPYRHMGSSRPGALPHLKLAALLDERSADPRHKAMRTTAVTRALASMKSARVVEVGCGTGTMCREMASREQVRSVVGVDPCATFLDEARRRAADGPKETYVCASGTSLPLPDASADLVVCWTVLMHLDPLDVMPLLWEARRILVPGGRILLADNDMANWRLDDAAYDPLQAPLQFYVDSFVSDAKLSRTFPELLRSIGLEPCVRYSNRLVWCGELTLYRKRQRPAAGEHLDRQDSHDIRMQECDAACNRGVQTGWEGETEIEPAISIHCKSSAV